MALGTLHLHYLCPYARRALYCMSYCGLSATIVEQDLINKSEQLKKLNPLAKLPTLETEDKVIFESYGMMQYFVDISKKHEILPEDPAERAVVFSYQDLVGQLPLNMLRFVRDQTKWNGLENYLKTLNDHYLADGNYYMHRIVGKNNMTINDLALFPFFEMMNTMTDNEQLGKYFSGIELSNVWEWYNRIDSQPWIQTVKPPMQYIKNEIQIRLNQQPYQGLTLPLSKYETVFIDSPSRSNKTEGHGQENKKKQLYCG